MNELFKQTLAGLLPATTHEQMVDVVMQTVDTLLQRQTNEQTVRYFQFMRYSEMSVESKISSILSNLDTDYSASVGAVPTDGYICGFYNTNTTEQKMVNLVFGIPNLYGIYFIVNHDLVKQEKTIHCAYGAPLGRDYVAMGTNLPPTTDRAATPDSIHNLLVILDNLANNKPNVDKQLDETKTMKYAQELYESRWSSGKKVASHSPTSNDTKSKDKTGE